MNRAMHPIMEDKKKGSRKGKRESKSRQRPPSNVPAINPISPAQTAPSAGPATPSQSFVSPSYQFFSDGLERFSGASMNAYDLYLRKKKEADDKDMRKQMQRTGQVIQSIGKSYYQYGLTNPNADDKRKKAELEALTEKYTKENKIVHPEVIQLINQAVSYNAADAEYQKDSIKDTNDYVKQFNQTTYEQVHSIETEGKTDKELQEQQRSAFEERYKQDLSTFPLEARNAIALRQARSELREGNLISAQALSEIGQIDHKTQEQIKDSIAEYRGAIESTKGEVPAEELVNFNERLEKTVDAEASVREWEAMHQRHGANYSQKEKASFMEKANRLAERNKLAQIGFEQLHDVEKQDGQIKQGASYESRLNYLQRVSPESVPIFDAKVNELLANMHNDPNDKKAVIGLISRSESIEGVEEYFEAGAAHIITLDGKASDGFKNRVTFYDQILAAKDGNHKRALNFVSSDAATRGDFLIQYSLAKEHGADAAVKIFDSIERGDNNYRYTHDTHAELKNQINKLINKYGNNPVARMLAHAMYDKATAAGLAPKKVTELIKTTMASLYATGDNDADASIPVPRRVIRNAMPTIGKYSQAGPIDIYHALSHQVENLSPQAKNKMRAAGIKDPDAHIGKGQSWFGDDYDKQDFSFDFTKIGNEDAVRIKLKTSPINLFLFHGTIDQLMYEYYSSEEGSGSKREGVDLKELRAD